MDGSLFVAARTGDVGTLCNLLPENNNPAALPECSKWTPLHIACLFRNVNFAREFLRRRPQFLKHKNPDGCTALHLASSIGNLEMVKMLLTFGCDDESMDRDNDGRNPLHHAVIKGSVEVVIELLRACPESALAVTAQKETIFHLAVKHRVSVSDELFSRLLRGDYTDYLLNLSDKKGNTVLHLASIRKQTQIIRQLTERRPRLDVNAVNSSGLTPLDLLVVDPLNLKDMKIEGIMKSAGGIRLNQSQEQREHLKSMASGLLVMASLIAATSCQFAIFLQVGFWETLSPATDGNVTLISNSTHFRVSTSPGANATAAMQMPVNATASHYEKTRSYLFLAIFDGLAFMLSLCLILLALMPTSTNKFSRLKWLSSYLLTLLLMPFLIALFISIVSYRATDTPSTDNFILNLFLPFILGIIVLVLIPIVNVVRVIIGL